MIKNQKRTTSAENDYVLTNVTYTTPTVSTAPTNKTNKDLILTIQKRNFWKEESQTDKPTATIKIPLSDYVLRTYLEENYYNKTAIDGFIEQYKIKVVVLESKNNLPQSGDSRYADTSYLFLVRHTHTIDSSSQGDYFDEYIWNNDKSDYERIGNTDIDLSPYLKIADFNAWKNNTYTPTITEIQNDITFLQTDKENVSNKVTSISDSSTDTQYPSAKLLNTELKKKEDTSNKVTSVNDLSTDTQYPSAKLLNTELKKKEDVSNKVTSINDLSTDTQYPSAKLLNTELKTKEDISNKATIISASSTDNEYPTAKAVHSIASTKLDKSDAFSKNYNDLTNKPTIPTKTSDLINDSNFITEHQDISGKEDKSNKVTSISPDSTDTQYPSAKCVYDLIGNISGDAPGITPFSHTHGNITNEGAIGSTANKPLITGTNGVIQTGSFGIDDNTFCEGSDPRLSDSRIPKFIDINASSTDIKDLDNYTTGGFYYCDMGNEAPYINNCPKTGTNNTAFFLLVEAWNSNHYSVKQTLTYYSNQKTYVRTKVNTSWSPWYLIQTTNNYIASTHTSSTSAWTGTSDEIVKLTKGTVIYYYLAKEPTTSPVTLDLTLANGDTTGAKNVYFSNGTRLSNQYRSNSMICLYCSGNDWFVVNPYKFDISTNHQGGTNLLQGTQNFNGAKGILQRYTIGTYRNLKYVLVNNANETSYSDISFTIPANTFDYGEKYTLSFWALGSGQIKIYNYGNTNFVKTKVINCTSGGSGADTYSDGNCTFNLNNNKWQRYFVTWELNPTSDSSNDLNVDKMIVLRTMPSATARFAGVMYERGEIPHDWSPSPLDNSLFDYSDIKGTDNTAGYIKALRLQIGSAYQDKPISIEIYQRNRKTKNIINIGFQNLNGVDPDIATGFFSYYGDENFKAYLYKESAGVWSLITSKAYNNKYGEMLVKISNPNPGIYISELDTHIASLPSDTTSNPLYTASCLEKNTPCTVTYTDGSTDTINFVTR